MTRSSRLAAVLATAVAAALLPAADSLAAPAGPAAAAAPVATRRAGTGYERSGRIVVGFAKGASRSRRDAALAKVRARVRRAAPGLGAVLVRVPGNPLAAARVLRRDPAVAYVEPEGTWRAHADRVGRERAELGVDVAQTTDPAFDGRGVEVAVVDSLVDDTRPDLDVVFDANWNHAVDENDGTAVPAPACRPADCPHGTAVASVLAAKIDGQGMAGVAPGVTVVSYNVAAADGDMSTYAVASAITAATQRSLADPARRLRVINLSLGGPFASITVRNAIAQARAAGIVVVASSGNDGGERANAPAGDPYVLSVGASREVLDGVWRVAPWTNKGDLDVLAPGERVLGWFHQSGSWRVVELDGTSFAAPMVSGLAAALAGKGVVGDAARAAIVAAAEGRNADSSPPVFSGAGRADFETTRRLVASGQPFTALFVDGGAQVANVVGTRMLEAVRADPDAGALSFPTLSASHGRVTAGGSGAGVGGPGVVVRTTARFDAPAANLGYLHGRMTATGSVDAAAPDDVITLPMRFLDPADGPEGTPAQSGEFARVQLVRGTRSTFIRSVGLHDGAKLSWRYRYAPESRWSTIYVWEPASDRGTADAALEPWGFQEFTDLAGSDYFVVGDADNVGRWKVGWVTFAPEDNGTYEFQPFFRRPGLGFRVPHRSSDVGTQPPVRVDWRSIYPHPVTYDVQWTTRVRATRWVTKPWTSWIARSTGTAAMFGGGSPALAPGHTYYLRARAVDDLGNFSPWVHRTVIVPLNDNARGNNYYGRWAIGRSSSRWYGDTHYTYSRGARHVLLAEGSRFQVIGDRCPRCGQFRVYVDDVYRGTVDSYSPATRVRQVLWDSRTLRGGIRPHKITLVNLGTPGRPALSLDGTAIVR